jgi:ABC-type transporter Mla MlaB component
MTTRRRTAGTGRKAAPSKKAAASRMRATAHALASSKGGSAARASGRSASANGHATTTPRTSAKGRTSANCATFPADFTIAQAGDVRVQLAHLVTKPASVTLDLSPIRRIDTAGLQVLIAFIRDRRAAGRAVECAGATESFLVTAQLLGLGAFFGATALGPA